MAPFLSVSWWSRLIGLLIYLFLNPFFSQAMSLHPDALTCEYFKDPLGIDIQKPRLSWTLASDVRGDYQSAYEIIVSENNFSGKKRQVVWQTGRQSSAQSLHVEYNGLPLKSFTRYYWRVRVYDKNGKASAWSNDAWFETAMLDEKDWKAKWISDGSKQFMKDEDFYKDDPMPVFRKQFTIAKKIAAARLYISGLGYFEATLNGRKVGDHILDPGFTAYRTQVLYVSFDITDLLKTGMNVARIMVGNGWYNPLPLRLFGRFNLRDVQQTGRPCVKAQLLITFADGTIQFLNTDESWEVTGGPVLRNSVYLGEQYDARLENPLLNNWHKADPTNGPSGVLTSQMQPPIHVSKIIKPVKITETGRDTFIVDMGQNFAGVAKIKVAGSAGTKVSLRYGEDLFQDGRLNYLTTVAGQIKEIFHLSGGPGAPKTAWQQDAYTLKGIGEETWSPRFTFHGFRYVEVTGWPGKPSLENIEGLVMNADLETNGSFTCSNKMFNHLQDVIKWTFLSNVFSIQSDCPGREKMGYGGDMVATSEAFIYNFNMAEFYSKSLRDFENDQQKDGGITETAPFTGIADKGVGGYSGPLGWQLAFPFLQKQLYDYYGDKRILARYYPALKKQLEFLKSKSVDGLFYWDISDHETLDTKPEAFTASAFYYHHLILAAEFANILGLPDDAAAFGKLAQTVKSAIIKKYYVPHTGRFDNATQTAQVFALYYGFSPEPDSTLNVLMKEYARHHWHLSTGIFATKMQFDALREKELNEMAYRLADQRDFPGWGYMLAKGATTLWETWAYPDNAPSQNHPMFGSVSEWFYKSLLGITAAAPGFEKIKIKPEPAGDLTWVRGSYVSVRGTIGCDWNRSAQSFTLHISIPANTTAEVWVPSKDHGAITEGEHPVSESKDVQLAGYSHGYAILNVASGVYVFNSEL